MGGLAAIVLAAGLSSRMRENKLLLPWKGKTVIAWVVLQLLKAGFTSIVVVTGRDRLAVESQTSFPNVKHVFNEKYENGEMLTSLQAGLRSLSGETNAVMIVLGDQPQIEIETIRLVAGEYLNKKSCLLVLPSFENRRGHPWMVSRELWDEIFGMEPPENMRTFLNQHSGDITYVQVQNNSIFADIDTPQDYQDALRK